MDGFFHLSTNSILTNMRAKVAKNGGKNILNFDHHFLPILPARLSI